MCSCVLEGSTRSNIRWRSVPIPPHRQSEAHAPRLCFQSTHSSLESGKLSAPLEFRLRRQFETLFRRYANKLGRARNEIRNQEPRPHLLESFILVDTLGKPLLL